MSIYDINFSLAWNNLLPTTKRKSKMLAWGKSLLKPLQWLRDLIFGGYADNVYDLTNLYPYYNNGSLYTSGQRILSTDKKVYENILACTGVVPSPVNSNNWLLVLDNFIGVRVRAKFNSQIIVLENALNQWFLTIGFSASTPQIYVQNNNVANGFLMGATSATSSTMANNSLYTTSYMGLTYTPTAYDFTVYVPNSTWSVLGTTTQDKINNVRRFVDKYKLTGIKYNVLNF